MTSWEFAGSTTYNEFTNWSESLKHGEKSEFPAYAPSNPPMIGDTLPSSLHWYSSSSLCRVGITISNWLFQSIHDPHAISTFDYILPLMVCQAWLLRWFELITPIVTAWTISFCRTYVCRRAFAPAFQTYLVVIVNDNDDLSARASLLLVRMCGVTPPRTLINPLLDAIFEAIQMSPARISHVQLYDLPNIHCSHGGSGLKLCL
jgi:hypothetical protein